jgi:hypothetical protein
MVIWNEMAEHHDHKDTPQAMDHCKSMPDRLRHEADHHIFPQNIEYNDGDEYHDSQSQIYDIAVEHRRLFDLHFYLLPLL